MAKQARWDIKRKLDYALKDMEAAQDLIVETAVPFEAAHKDYYDAFCALVSAIEAIKSALAGVRDRI